MNRVVTAAIVLILLVLAGIQIANPHSYLSELVGRVGEAGSGPEASLTDLQSVEQLRATFSRDGGHPRLILLLSPT